MWDLVVLTAGSNHQKKNFESQLRFLDLDRYSKSVIVLADEPEGVRIGSGGSTILAINYLKQLYGKNDIKSKKVLLCHSGGLAQRTPHLSAYGKIFAYLSNGKTFIETKLELYRQNLVENLPEGLMITASDVLEDMRMFRSYESQGKKIDFIIFAHVSSVEVASQHGVFLLDEAQKLKCVLQKPSIEQMKEMNAIGLDGKALTDSCFCMSWSICLKLVENEQLQQDEPITEELCCYGDFMRPMGHTPRLDYIRKSTPGLAKYRKIFAEVFSSAEVKIFSLGPDSFFHLGTSKDFLDCVKKNSTCYQRLFESIENEVRNGSIVIGEAGNSFSEFSLDPQNYLARQDNSIISGVEFSHPCSFKSIPDNLVMFTMVLKEKKFVTIIFGIDDDIKKVCDIKWNDRITNAKNCSLWDARLFKTFNTRQESCESTVFEYLNGISISKDATEDRISFAEAIELHDMDEELNWRRTVIESK